jgi:ribonuclease BN (tRNA processing enzyme)
VKIAFLGTRSFDPDNASSLGAVLEVGSSTVLLDCGPYTVAGLANLRLHPEDLDAVFVSHDHADHSGGFAWLVANWLLTGPKTSDSLSWIVPHADLAVGQHVQVAYAPLFSSEAPRAIRRYESEAQIGDLNVTPVELAHTVETWGVHLRAAGGSLLFLPDSSEVALKDADLPSADVVLMSVWGPEATSQVAEQFKFVTARGAGRVATKVGARTLLVQHLADPGTWPEVAAEARESFAGEVINPPLFEWIDL